MNPKRRIIPVFIPNEGCRNNCVFCDQHRITGVSATVNGDVLGDILNSALLEIRGCVSLPATRDPLQLAFYGGSFTAMPIQRQFELLKAAEPFLSLDPLNSIRISTRPDCIDNTILEMLKRYGVSTIELGAQSMCDDVLSASQRGHTANDVAKASALIKRAGFALVLQMMTGLPRDTSEKSIYTVKRFIELAPDAVRIYPTVVIKGSKLHNMWSNGEYKEHTIDEAVELCAMLLTIFEDAGIPVIRLGLNPTEALGAGDAVAGAYHPSLGELVYSRAFYNKAENLLGGIAPGSNITLAVSRGAVSKMTGNRRWNIEALTAKFSLQSLKVVEIDLDPGKVKIHEIS